MADGSLCGLDTLEQLLEVCNLGHFGMLVLLHDADLEHRL